MAIEITSAQDASIPLEVPISWSSLGVGFAAVLLTVVLRRRYVSPISDIPGPFWASITRLWHVWIILEGRQNERLVALHRRHGPFVRIAPNEVSVCHRDGSTLLLRANLHKGEWYRVTAVPDLRFQNPMSTTDPKEKNALSRHFAPAYALAKVRRWESAIDENMGRLLSWIDAFAKDGKPMHLDKFITYTTFDNIGSVFFSESFGFIKAGHDLGGTLQNNVALSKFAAVAGFFIVPLRILVNPLTSWMLVLPMGRLYRTTLAALRKRINNPNASDDMISHWLRASASSGALNRREIEAQAMVNVGAGAEPVSTAIQSVVYHMIRHPESWMAARAEIDATRAGGRCENRVVSLHDAQRLPYLQACIKEALRLFSPTTMGLPRKAPKGGITIAGRHFPEGTILSISSHAVHASTDMWGNDAHEWKPERWMAGGAKELEKNWLVFSAGFMTCPGRHFALMQISKAVASLVHEFDIRQVDPGMAWKYQANFTALTHSWPVYVERRGD